MKTRKFAVMATVATVAALAFGTASASAANTKLCKVNTSSCTPSNTYPSGSAFKTVGTFLVGGEACEFILGFETGTAVGIGVPLTAKIFQFSITHCPAAFTVAASHLNWSFPITISGTGPNGTGEVLSGGSGTPGFEVTRSFGHCLYELPPFTISITGGTVLSGSLTRLRSLGPPMCPNPEKFEFEGPPMPKFWVTE